MYKWFVWSDKEKKYFPLPGLKRFPRSFYPSAFVPDFFGFRITQPMFSIPMFNVHNAVI